MKHFSIIAIVLVIFLFSSLMASEVNTLVASKAQVESDKIIVPLELSNIQPMTALELPLQYSKGVTLTEVDFAGTRSENFDFKIANIDKEKSTVIIALIPMVYGGDKPDLEVGKGVIANLVFRIDDPAVQSIELTPTSTKNPDHSLMFLTSETGSEVKEVTPEIIGMTVALNGSEAVDAVLPTQFALMQNAPNPFNPTTVVAYDLPKPAHVRLEIFNVLGQRVRTLVDNNQPAGTQSVTWDGNDNSGASVASGIYFYRISAGDFNASWYPECNLGWQ